MKKIKDSKPQIAEKTKAAVAERLARMHAVVEPGIIRIFRVVANRESQADEPIKLLEVNENTIAVGIVPVSFSPYPAGDIPYRSTIIEISPQEFHQLHEGILSLPSDWLLGSEYLLPPRVAGE